MRLTLRTMLAYLDDILDPADADKLGRKIQDSEFASGLVHRIRSASRRAKMGVPPVEGKGMGQDANTVAEYLDNVMPPERVPDMEKVCLESDVHLSEVAACHQILTIVLGQTAEVDQGLRDRAYLIGAPESDRVSGVGTLGDEMGDGSASPEAPPVAAPPVSEPPREGGVSLASKRQGKPVPDYLRVGKASPWKPLAITMLVAFALSAVALRAMGPFDRSHPLMRLFGGGESAVVASAPDEAMAPSGGVGEAEVGGGSVSDEVDPLPGSSPTVDDISPGGDALPSDAVSDEPQAGVDPTEATENLGAPSAPVTPSSVGDGVPASPDGPPDAGQAPAPSGGAGSEGAGGEGMFPATEPSGVVDVVEPPSDQAEPVANDQPAPAVEVGFVKPVERHFLARSTPSNGDWLRLEPRTAFYSGDRLLVLPTYRPEIQLLPAVQVSFAGASQVVPMAPSPQQEPGVRIDYGRMFFATAGVAGARVHLDLDGFHGILSFLDPTSEVAVEVRRYLPPGLHPEHDVVRRVICIYPTVGRIEWQVEGAAVAIPLGAGEVRVVVDEHAETLAVSQLPPWILREDLRDVDRLASEALEPFVVVGRPISLSLRERTEDRKSEVRSLAARCLAYLDDYEPLVSELGDDRQRAFWVSDVDVLVDSLPRSASSAESVRVALERFGGEVAEELYRLLWGYSPAQLEEGSAAHLVGLLDSVELKVRVLAFENLRRITGQTQLYRPETSEARRKSTVIRWREQLERGEIVYQSPPSPYQL